MCGVCALLRLALAEIRRSNTRSGGCGALLDFPAQTLRSYLVFLEGLAVSVLLSAVEGGPTLCGESCLPMCGLGELGEVA